MRRTEGLREKVRSGGIIGLLLIPVILGCFFVVQYKSDTNPLFFGTWQFQNVAKENFNSRRGIVVANENVHEGEAVATLPGINCKKGEYDLCVEHSGNPGSVNVAADGRQIGYYDLPADEPVTHISLSFEEAVSELSVSFFTSGGPEEAFVLTSVRFDSGGRLFANDAVFAYILLAAFLMFIYVRYFIKGHPFERRELIFCCYAATVIFASYPLLNEYLLWGDDINSNLMRIENIRFSIENGYFPVLLWPRTLNGYGSIGTLNPYLFLIPAALMRVAGISAITAYKSCIVLINVLAVVNMRSLAKRFMDSEKAVFLAVFLFMLAPYRISDVYFRAALGESLAFSFMPLFFLGIYEIFYGNRDRWYILVIALSGICQSHVLTCVLVCICMAPLVLVAGRLFKDQRWIAAVKCAAFTVLLNLWYIIPFIYTYIRTEIGSALLVNDYFFSRPGLSALFLNTPWERFPKISVSFGYAGIMCLFFAAVYFLERQRKDDRTYFRYLVLLFIGFTVMQTTLFSWETLADFKFIKVFTGRMQFAFRFLEISTTILCFIGALALYESQNLKKYGKALYVAVCVLAVAGTMTILDPYAAGEIYKEKSSAIPSMQLLNDYTSDNVDVNLLDPMSQVRCGYEGMTVTGYNTDGFKTEFDYTSPEDSFVDIPKIYYCIYQAKTSSGIPLTLYAGDNGLLRIVLPKAAQNEHVEVSLRYPVYYIAAVVISFVSLIAFIFFIFKRTRTLRGNTDPDA